MIRLKLLFFLIENKKKGINEVSLHLFSSFFFFFFPFSIRHNTTFREDDREKMIEKEKKRRSLPCYPLSPIFCLTYNISIFQTPQKVNEKGKKIYQAFLRSFFSLSIHQNITLYIFKLLKTNEKKRTRLNRNSLFFYPLYPSFSIFTLARTTKKKRKRYFFHLFSLFSLSLSFSYSTLHNITLHLSTLSARKVTKGRGEGSPNLACYDKSKRGHRG